VTHDLGEQVRVTAVAFAPEVECRPRYSAAFFGLIANTSYPAATSAATHGPRSVSIPIFTRAAASPGSSCAQSSGIAAAINTCNRDTPSRPSGSRRCASR
jgi:hypothetical protein